MRAPLQITFRNMDASAAMDARVRTLVARLEKFSADVMSCHVIIEAPSGRQQQGALFRVRIDMTVPHGKIAAGESHRLDHSHEDPYVALRDAFRAARRNLEDYERRRRRRITSSAH